MMCGHAEGAGVRPAAYNFLLGFPPVRRDLGHVAWSCGLQPLAVLSHCCAQTGMHLGGGPALSQPLSFRSPQN